MHKVNSSLWLPFVKHELPWNDHFTTFSHSFQTQKQRPLWDTKKNTIITDVCLVSVCVLLKMLFKTKTKKSRHIWKRCEKEWNARRVTVEIICTCMQISVACHISTIYYYLIWMQFISHLFLNSFFVCVCVFYLLYMRRQSYNDGEKNILTDETEMKGGVVLLSI